MNGSIETAPLEDGGLNQPLGILAKQDERFDDGQDEENKKPELNSDTWRSVPIRKEISDSAMPHGEGVFLQEKKNPTEIEPEKPEVVSVAPSAEKLEEKVVSKRVSDYVEGLTGDKSKLRILAFDIKGISFERAKEVLAKAKESGVINEQNERQILSLFEDEKSENVSTAQESVEVLDQILSRARLEYVEHLVPYSNKVKEDQKSYQKMMGDLGVEKEMPVKDKPKELILARKEYLEARKKRKGLERDTDFFEVEEVEKLKQEIIGKLEERKQKISQVGKDGWDKNI